MLVSYCSVKFRLNLNDERNTSYFAAIVCHYQRWKIVTHTRNSWNYKETVWNAWAKALHHLADKEFTYSFGSLLSKKLQCKREGVLLDTHLCTHTCAAKVNFYHPFLPGSWKVSQAVYWHPLYHFLLNLQIYTTPWVSSRALLRTVTAKGKV